jgi:serine/threonine-protein phosphatase 2A regulatory subunit B
LRKKISKIRWLPQQDAVYFLLSQNDKRIKLWKISEWDKSAEVITWKTKIDDFEAHLE